MAGPDAPPQREHSRGPAGGPGVDTASAQEFQREILTRISAPELAAIAGDLERKSAAMRELLAPGAPDADALRRVLRMLFATRRHVEEILDATGPARLGGAVADLVGGDGPVAARFDRFCQLDGLPSAGFELAAELLHFTDPAQRWLWTRWMWDPAAETGALALVTTDDMDLTEGESPGEVYVTVGRATAVLERTGKAAGFTAAGQGLFGTDVFLAAVYGVYMFTILRMRMTQEFTRLVPPLPALIRRLLGVYHLEV